MLLQILSLPTLPARTSNSLSDVFRLTRRRGVQLGMLAILLLMTGHFAGSVYVRPFLEQVTLLETGPIALALLGFGIASVIGNVAGGRMADASIRMRRNPRARRPHSCSVSSKFATPPFLARRGPGLSRRDLCNSLRRHLVSEMTLIADILT